MWPGCAGFFLRGHGRWIAKGWTWATHGHLRADARAAWLAGDSEARRAAQELIRADARARWAKIGIVAHRITVGGLLVSLPRRGAGADRLPGGPGADVALAGQRLHGARRASG